VHVMSENRNSLPPTPLPNQIDHVVVDHEFLSNINISYPINHEYEWFNFCKKIQIIYKFSLNTLIIVGYSSLRYNPRGYIYKHVAVETIGLYCVCLY